MKFPLTKSWRVLAFGLSMMFFPYLGQASGPKEGTPAPHIFATSLDRKTWDSEALRGQVVVISFWATWCTYCRQELADLDRLYRRHGADGLVVIGINMDDDANATVVRKLAANFSFPMALRAEAAFQGYGRIWRLPLTFVIDRRGILRRDGWDNEPMVSYQLLEETIGPLLKEPS